MLGEGCRKYVFCLFDILILMEQHSVLMVIPPYQIETSWEGQQSKYVLGGGLFVMI